MLANPKQLVTILLLLVLIGMALWFARYTQKQEPPKGYIGSDAHHVSMEGTIETVVLRMLERFPELYEGTIFTMIARARGGAGVKGEIDRWTD